MLKWKFNQTNKSISAVASVAIALILLCTFILNEIFPLPEIYPDGPSVVVVASNGKVLRSFGDKKGVHRYLTRCDEVTPFYIDALLYYEDQYFFYHPGVNPISLVRAAYQWISHGKVISGGSTLTMQVARLIAPHSRTITGKIQQIWRAFQLEWYFSKEEILTMYLNLAPFGGNIEGIEAASRHYFNKTAKKINKNEAALLVVLPQKPSIYRPDRYPQKAKEMRNKILLRLVEGALLQPTEAELLCKENVDLAQGKKYSLAPLLSRYLKRKYPQKHVIETTINYEVQSHLAKLLTRTIKRLSNNVSAAVLVIKNKSGNVLAYQGSADFTSTTRFGHVDMIRAVRSPGSTLKPFIYGLAFEQGLIHTESLLSDIPTSFSGYKPRNLNGRFSGAVSASNALKKSLNIPVIQIFNRIKPTYFDQRLAAAGIHLKHKKVNLSVGLGGTGTNLWNLAHMYRSLGAAGKVRTFSVVKNTESSPEKTLLTQESSWMVFNILNSLSAPDRVVPSTRRRVAWKTGTSYGYRDFWAIGVSADYTVAVWVGRPDAAPLVGYLGATLAAPLMFDVFDLLPRDKHTITMPIGVEKKRICWPGGRSIKVTHRELCKSQQFAFTFHGVTPPTMESNGKFVIKDSWPQALRLWQKQHNVSVHHAQPEAILRILNLKTGQHLFQSQVESIPLTTNQETTSIQWYINYKQIPEPILHLKEYLGNTVITACYKSQCDSQTVYIHQ